MSSCKDLLRDENEGSMCTYTFVVNISASYFHINLILKRRTLLLCMKQRSGNGEEQCNGTFNTFYSFRVLQIICMQLVHGKSLVFTNFYFVNNASRSILNPLSTLTTKWSQFDHLLTSVFSRYFTHHTIDELGELRSEYNKLGIVAHVPFFTTKILQHMCYKITFMNLLNFCRCNYKLLI